MAIGNQDAKVYRGDSLLLHVELSQADGTPFDASGSDLEWMVATSPSSLETDAVIRKTLGEGITVVEGGVDIALSTTDTDLPVGAYCHQLRIVDGDDASTAMTGTVVIRPAMNMISA